MIETYDKLLNCNEILRNNWSLLTEAFIDFYGEDKREEIISKFSKALPIAFNSPDYVEKAIKDIKKINSNTIYDSLMENAPTSLEKEDIFIEAINYFDNLIDKFTKIYNS